VTEADLLGISFAFWLHQSLALVYSIGKFSDAHQSGHDGSPAGHKELPCARSPSTGSPSSGRGIGAVGQLGASLGPTP